MSALDCDILIVGAGLAGAATAFHLRRESNQRVLIVEREDLPGTHSSGRNAAMIRERVDDPTIQPLVSSGAEFLRRGELAEFHHCGSVLLGLGEDDVSERVAPASGRGLWCPGDGVVDVSSLLHGYLRGQTVRYGTKVLRWRHQGSEVVVETSQGTVRCGLVVNAAGPWAGVCGEFALTPMNRHLFFTPPMAVVDRDWPFVWDIPQGFYFRPESGGLLLCVCDEMAADPGDYNAHDAPVEELSRLTETHLPDLGPLSIMQAIVGQRTFAADRRFVIGHDPRCQRVFHVAGLGGHGVAGSWAVGCMAAERILQGATDPAADFSFDRLLAPSADRGRAAS